MPGLSDIERVEVQTPFGSASAVMTLGSIDCVPVAFLPRHGKYHEFSPTRVPMRANIWAFKSVNVNRLVSVSAVGSMRAEIHPLDMVVPDQIFDRTVLRERTFFDDMVVHVSMAEPFCPQARQVVLDASAANSATVHDGGTYICIEGPQFSTKGESRIYRSWGIDVIGMTAVPEARLAREAGLCYVTLAMVTDYDVWHETEEVVTVQTVMHNLKLNIANAQRIVRAALLGLQADWNCSCSSSLHDSVATAPAGVTAADRDRLAFLMNGPAG
jgi:5'-methylthioadenosine phosphorylase